MLRWDSFEVKHGKEDRGGRWEEVYRGREKKVRKRGREGQLKDMYSREREREESRK